METAGARRAKAGRRTFLEFEHFLHYVMDLCIEKCYVMIANAYFLKFAFRSSITKVPEMMTCHR